MTIERRAQITTGVLILFALGTISILFWSSRQVGQGIKRIEATAQVVQSAFRLRVLMHDFLEHGSKRIPEQWGHQNTSLGQILNSETIVDSIEAALLEDVRKSYRAVNLLYPRLVEMTAPSERRDQRQDLKAKEMLTSLMFLQLEHLVQAAIDLNEATQSLTLARRNFVQELIVALGISAGVFIFINILLIRKSVVKPLHMLSKGAEKIGLGEFDYVAEIKSDDEVGKLTRAFNTMIASLQKRTTALKEAKDELELRIAERTAAYETVRTQNELLEAVRRAQTQFISHTSPEELFRNLLHDLLTLTNSEFGFIGEILYTPEGQIYLRDRAITDIAWSEESRKIYEKFANDKGLDFHNIRGFWGTAIVTGEPVISNDPGSDPRRSGMPEGHPALHCFLGVPLRSDGKVIGMVGIANRPGGYTQQLVDFLQPYLTTCAGIIEACRIENRRREAEQQLAHAHADLERKVLDRTAELGLANERLVFKIEERKRAENVMLARLRLVNYAASHSMDELLQATLDEVEALTGSSIGFYHFLEPDQKTLLLQNWSTRTLQKMCTAEGKGVHYNIDKAGVWVDCVHERRPVVHNDYSALPHRKGLPPGHADLIRELVVPVIRGDRIVAILGVGNKPTDYIESDIETVLLLADLAWDITERKRAEQAVKAERQRLYDVLETLPVYVCLLDEDYRMPFTNRYFRETFGESQGRRCHDFLFDRTEPCEICETYTVMKTREPHHWYWTGPNGRDYDIYDFPFTDTDGSFRILEMGIDITERKQAEDALIQILADLSRSNADLEQFAYVASHDLQEPLRNVASCMQLLEKGYKNKLGQDADKLMGYAVDSVVRMKSLIQDLLAYSRVSTTGKPPQRTDCEEVLEQTLSNLRSAVEETGALVSRDPLPTVVADSNQLIQVFQNLIGNALKFRSVEPSRVHVSAVKDGGEWVFSVKDNGIGIESRHLDRIFVIFQRLNKRSEYGGTGMGLAIVKKIVERHRGRIWAESEPGKGTTFCFTIPVKESIT